MLATHPPDGPGPRGAVESFEPVFEASVAAMWNAHPEWAAGVVLTAGEDPHHADAAVAVRARARRWLGPRHSVELEGGVHFIGVPGSRGDDRATGVTLGARFNADDWASAFLRWDAFGIPAVERDPGGMQNALRGGASIGRTPALVGLVFLLLGYASKGY